MSEIVFLQRKVQLRVIECGTCGVAFALPEEMYDTYYKQGGFWHCPNGHRRGWTDGADKAEMAKLRKRVEWAEAHAEDERKAATAARAKAAAADKKLKNLNRRVAHGVCPCCHRTFKQLAAHMARKHPGRQENKP